MSGEGGGGGWEGGEGEDMSGVQMEGRPMMALAEKAPWTAGERPPTFANYDIS